MTTLFASFSRGDKEASLWEGKLRVHHQVVFICFKNTYSDCSYEFIPTEQILWKRQNTAWPLQSEPTSDQAVSTADAYSIRKLSTK